MIKMNSLSNHKSLFSLDLTIAALNVKKLADSWMVMIYLLWELGRWLTKSYPKCKIYLISPHKRDLFNLKISLDKRRHLTTQRIMCSNQCSQKDLYKQKVWLKLKLQLKSMKMPIIHPLMTLSLNNLVIVNRRLSNLEMTLSNLSLNVWLTLWKISLVPWPIIMFTLISDRSNNSTMKFECLTTHR